MTEIHRRQFLQHTAQSSVAASIGAALAAPSRGARSVSPNEKITLGVVGVRGRGALLAMGFALRDDCQVAYLADVDTRVFDTAASKGYMRFTPSELGALPRREAVTRAQGLAPKCVQDRKPWVVPDQV